MKSHALKFYKSSLATSNIITSSKLPVNVRAACCDNIPSTDRLQLNFNEWVFPIATYFIYQPQENHGAKPSTSLNFFSR